MPGIPPDAHFELVSVALRWQSQLKRRCTQRRFSDLIRDGFAEKPSIPKLNAKSESRPGTHANATIAVCLNLMHLSIILFFRGGTWEYCWEKTSILSFLKGGYRLQSPQNPSKLFPLHKFTSNKAVEEAHIALSDQVGERSGLSGAQTQL